MKLPLIVVSVLTIFPTLVSPDAVIPAQSQAGPESDSLNGTYLCEGFRPDGAPYHGTVLIVRHNGAYQVVWNVGDEEQYLGIGLVNGDVLAVSYFGGMPGVVAYKVDRREKGARLVGQWTVANADGQVFRETLTRLTQNVTALPMPQQRPQRVRPSMRGVRPA